MEYIIYGIIWNIYYILYIHYWLVVSTPQKSMSSSVGMMTFPVYVKITNVPNHQPEYRFLSH